MDPQILQIQQNSAYLNKQLTALGYPILDFQSQSPDDLLQVLKCMFSLLSQRQVRDTDRF